IVKVKVMEVDIPRKRIGLSMRMDDQPGADNKPARGADRNSGRSAGRKPQAGQGAPQGAMAGALAQAMASARKNGR
ncbi:MAG TPA: hypothetical protein DHW72_13755, partial [Marinobacter hydrocarbonoclasticus]|nr:hypothetical protein [Marinobacter nauticus]